MSRTASKGSLLAFIFLLSGCGGGGQMDAGTDRPKTDAKKDLGSAGTSGGGGSGVDASTGSDTRADVQLATCTNRKLDGDETDVDCGGSCPVCPPGNICKVDGDCQSKTCVGGFCDQLHCADNMKNGSESDIDCGGGCLPCFPGR